MRSCGLRLPGWGLALDVLQVKKQRAEDSDRHQRIGYADPCHRFCLRGMQGEEGAGEQRRYPVPQ